MKDRIQDPSELPKAEELALLAALQRDIAERLRPVCGEMDEATFDALVRDIATMKIKYGPEADVSGSLRNELNTILDDEPEGPT